MSLGGFGRRGLTIILEIPLFPLMWLAEKICKAISENINVVFNVSSSFSLVLNNDYESVVSKEWRIVMPKIKRQMKKTRDSCVWIFSPS